jgi:hypothetical protein
MFKTVLSVMGAALLFNVSVASAAKKQFQQDSGLNATVGANGQLDACRSWSLLTTLSESSLKTEPGAKVVLNRAIVSFTVSNSCNDTFSYFDVDVPDVAKLTGNLTGASLNLNTPVALTTCGYVVDDYECTTSTTQLAVALSWSSTGSPVRFRQHITNLAPDGVRSSIKIEGSSRDATTTGQLSFGGQTYTLTADNVYTSTLTSEAKMFVVLTRN